MEVPFVISVIVPIYNAQKYLKECLESIANQTYKDIEVIMVNDGSTDDSELICRKYEQKYNNFLLINKENGGQMSAWIQGVRQSHGEYLAFVDSDDYIEPTMYEKMIECEKSTEADLVMCNFFDLDKKKATPRNSKLKLYYGKDEIDEIHHMVFPTLTEFISMSRWDKLFKREIFLKNMNKYCIYMARTFEDRFIVSTYFFSCRSFAYIPTPLYYWRKQKVSSSRKARTDLCDIIEILYNTQKQMLQDRKIYDKYKEELEVGKIDLIRSVVERNLCAKIPYEDKLKIANRLLTEENRSIVLRHKSACVGKFGKYIYFTYKVNSKLIMIGVAILASKLRKNSYDDAFD